MTTNFICRLLLLLLLLFPVSRVLADEYYVSGSVITEVPFTGKEILLQGNWKYTDDIHYKDFSSVYMTSYASKKNKLNAANLNYRKRRSLSSRSGLSHERQKLDITPIILKYAKKYEINPYIIKSVIEIESNYNPNAISSSGACGLMQLKPSTAKDMGVYDYWNPEKNIEAGSKYLRLMLNKFKKLDIALAAYNQGPGTVARAGGRIPNNTAKRYIEKFYKALKKGEV